MKNGVYAIHFKTPIGEGTGVAFLRDGTLEGGDAAIYYKGTFFIAGSTFRADVKTGRHSRVSGMINVMGHDTVTLTLEGTFDDKGEAFARGTAPEAPGVEIAVRMRRVSD